MNFSVSSRWLHTPMLAACGIGSIFGISVCFGQTALPSDVPAAPRDSGGTEAGTGFWQRDTLTGDWGGIRTKLDARGITPTLMETAETLGNVTGGVHTGFIFEGRLTAGLTVDLDKAVGWTGGQFYADAYLIHGRGLSANNLDNLFTVSSIEANRATRLHDLYLQQSSPGNEVSVRLGQIAADDEFIASRYGGNFVNAMFGWPGLPSNDLPAGGPIYPLSTPGVRVKYAPDAAWTFMSAVFNGNPAGPPTSGNRNPNPQLRDPGGTAFNLNSDVFAIIETSYGFAPDKDTPALPATYKLGAWYHSGKFADQHLDSTGLSLASPASSGIPRNHVNDFSVYAVADQMIWRRPGTADRGIAGFVRAMGAPDDRNLISFYVDGGFNDLGPIDGRDNDIAGIAFAYGAISNDLQSLDRDFLAFTGSARPVHDYEAVIELTYQAAITPWWTVQPDFQYVLHPGGHIPDPSSGKTVIGDAIVFGLRTSVTF